MVRLKELLLVWKMIFKNRRYTFLGVLIAIIFYELNVLIPNFKTLFAVSNGPINTLYIFYLMSFNFVNTIKLHSFISLIIISILLGMLFSIIVYKTKVIRSSSRNKKTGAIATTGIFLGLIAPGCAACGIGILSALGLGTAVITFLPYDGLELSILSILILGFAMFSISKGLLECKTCQIKPEQKETQK